MRATYPKSVIFGNRESRFRRHTTRIRPDHSETLTIPGATICSSRVRAFLFV